MVEAASPKLSVLRARVLAAQEKIATQGVTLRQAIEELTARGIVLLDYPTHCVHICGHSAWASQFKYSEGCLRRLWQREL
jgi:hypothetical protein